MGTIPISFWGELAPTPDTTPESSLPARAPISCFLPKLICQQLFYWQVMLPYNTREILCKPNQKETNCLQSLSWDFLGQDGLNYYERAGFVVSHCVFSIYAVSRENHLQTLTFLGPTRLSEDHLLPRKTASIPTPPLPVKKICECLSLIELPEGRHSPVCLMCISFLMIYCEFMTFVGQRRHFPRPVQMYWQSFHQEDGTAASGDSQME